MTNFQMVREFMQAMDQPVRTTATVVPDRERILRMALIQEEVGELQLALANHDLVGIADALADILYVVYGAGHTYGIDLDRCFAEVHRSNMSKLGPDGRPLKDANGKVTKGPQYSPPQLEQIITTNLNL